MIDAVNVPVQSVQASPASVVFAAARIKTGCSVRYETGSGRFVITKPGCYQVSYNADIAVPTGGTAGAISLAISQDGEVVAGTESTVTPAAVEEYNGVSANTIVQVYGCGSSVLTVVNTSSVAIEVQNLNLTIVKVC